MKIGNNFTFNFKGIDQNINSPQSSTENISAVVKNLATPSAENLQAINNINSQKGIENASIRTNTDAHKLIFSIKAPSVNTKQVKIIYNTGDNSETREVFSSLKDSKTGVFKVGLSVLDRKTNKIIPEINILSAEYFDESNCKINDEIPENMKINPKEFFTTKAVRKTTINGVTSEGEFDSISEGTVSGKLVKMEYEDVIRYKGNEPIIAILSKKDLSAMFMQIFEGTFTLPMNVKGLLASPDRYEQGGNTTDLLGHAVSRLRGRKIFALTNKDILKNIEQNYYNNPENPYIKIELGMDEMKVSGLKDLPKADNSKVTVPEIKFVNKLLRPEDKEFSPDTVGLKAFNLGQLKKIQEEGNFKVPSFFVVPAGVWDYTKKSPENIEVYGNKDSKTAKIGSYHFYTQKADLSENPSIELDGIRHMIVDGLILPKEIRTNIKDMVKTVFGTEEDKPLPQNRCLIARSSFNGEDSDTVATQGLYDSFPGIRTSENLYKGIKEVWASKWSDLAYMSRRNHKINHRNIQPNVIVQEVVPVDYTFTINTADPRRNNKNKIVCQLSQGVYSCFPNSPYVFEYDKTTQKITRTALATKKRTKPIDKMVMDDSMNLKYSITDYSKDPLNMSQKEYAPVMKKVFEVAKFIEEKFGGKPQDIEGGIIFRQNEKTGKLEPEIHIWQTRDVHLIKR